MEDMAEWKNKQELVPERRNEVKVLLYRNEINWDYLNESRT